MNQSYCYRHTARALASSLILLLIAVSCSQESFVESISDKSKQTTISTVEATIAIDNSADTKTVRKSDGKIYWNPGDEINVFFGTDKGKFTSSNTEDAAKASFNGSITISSVIGMNEGEDDDNCVWGLYPYNENATFDGTYVHTSLTNAQTGKAGSFADDLYITLAKSNSFKLSFYNTLAGIKFSVQKEGIKTITFSCNNGEVLTGDFKLKFGDDERPVVSEIANGKTSISLTPDGESFTVGEYYYIVFAPTTFSKGFSLKFTTNSEEGIYTYSKSISFPRNNFGTLSNADKDVEYKSVREYVDLGLSVKWATCNVGASKPEEYGDYFAWGETEPYYNGDSQNPTGWKSGKSSGYWWSSYKYCKGSSTTMTKYCNNSSYGYNGFTDSKTVLDPEDDAAHVNWGGGWRMPTKDEFDELCNSSNCTWTWTTVNGVNGYKVVSKKSGYEGNYIFLPAAGFRSGTYLDDVGSYGGYWSSSLYTDDPDVAYCLGFGSSNFYTSYNFRYNGISVRPVCR